MSDLKQIRKWNICLEVRLKCIDIVLNFFFYITYFLLINQTLGLNFEAPKISYQSKTQPDYPLVETREILSHY